MIQNVSDQKSLFIIVKHYMKNGVVVFQLRIIPNITFKLKNNARICNEIK